ncbi:splicing factor 3B subunit 5/RDS3 complex subunit 10, partial [Martensiomyces pterosporus]
MHAKYVGTGTADISKHRWLANQHRDTLAYYVADTSLATYISIAEGESIARTKFSMLQKMQQPCGPPP